MPPERRKCAKCGDSTESNAALKLHKFPLPKCKLSILRARKWADYAFPGKGWGTASEEMLTRLYFSHKMLCDNHFDATDYTTPTKNRLNKFSIPKNQTTQQVIQSQSLQSSVQSSMQSSVQSSNLSPSDKLTQQVIQSQSLHSSVQSSMQSSVQSSNPSPSDKLTQRAHCKKKKTAVLKDLNVKQSAHLTESERLLYKKCQKNVKEISRLRIKYKHMKAKHRAVLRDLTTNTNLSALIENTKNLSSPFKLLLQSQLTNVPRKLRGRRWELADKVMALTIYKKSPSCYRLLQRLYCLPSPGTLKGLLNKVPLKCGVNNQVFAALKRNFANASPEDKLAVLMFDEMSIRKNLQYDSKMDQINGFQDHGTQGRSNAVASYALVFMVAGIRKRFKQPIAHYFSGSSVTADRLVVLIKDVLKQCMDLGLDIVATTCDLDGVNISALNKLGSTEETPYFNFEGRQIVTILDPPHLLKCFRNMLMAHDINCPKQFGPPLSSSPAIAKWKHVDEFQNLDSSNANFVYAPALTKQHLHPNGKQKMKVKLAAQVLSHSVAAGIHAKVASNEMPNEALTTATVLDKMDQLFDSLNTDSASPRRGKVLSKNWSRNGKHKPILQEMKLFFKNINFIGARRPPPSKSGWLRSINGFEKLFFNLNHYKKVDTLSTRRLCQDPLENCFGCIRGNCGSNPNPTVEQFIGGLKTSIMSNLTHTAKKKNCEDDGNDIIENMCEYVSADNSSAQPIQEPSCISFEINYDEMLAEEGSGEAQACAYVSGFILKKLDTKCNNCENMLNTKEDFELNNIFIGFKEYDEKKRLQYPSSKMTETVEACASMVNKFLKENSHKLNLKQTARELMLLNVNFEWISACSEHKTFVTEHIINSVFMICVKRFCVLKNREYAEEASKQALKRKLKILKHN